MANHNNPIHRCTMVYLYTTLICSLLSARSVLGQVHASYDYKDVDYSQNYDYGEDGGGGGGGDYVSGGDYGGGYEYGQPMERPKVYCYACHYTRSPGHEQGEPNCAEPFIEDGIAVVECPDGSRCAKTKTVIPSEKLVMTTRSCLANCKDITEPESIVKCCWGSKCNNDRSVAHKITGSLLVLVVGFMLMVLI